MQRKMDMKEGKMKIALILLMALMTLILTVERAHADDLLEKINSLITYFSKQSNHYTGATIKSGHSRSEFYPIIREAAQRYSLDPHLIESIIKVESNFNPRAVSRKGAMGLMQLMPETAREIGVTRPFDPHQNILAGTYYYRLMLERYGNHRSALYAYNCGPECVKNGRIPTESRKYVNKVIRVYQDLKKRGGSNNVK
jgi:soluble lytic murein transglycosylase-like protein